WLRRSKARTTPRTSTSAAMDSAGGGRRAAQTCGVSSSGSPGRANSTRWKASSCMRSIAGRSPSANDRHEVGGQEGANNAGQVSAGSGRAALADRGAANGLYLGSYFSGGLVGSATLGAAFDMAGQRVCVAGIMAAL